MLTKTRQTEDVLEQTLWQQYGQATHRDEARTRLVEYYLPMVARLVERMSIRVRRQMEKEELLSVGVLGLHNALSSFDPQAGVPFVAFASKRIRGAILDELRKLDHLSRGQRHAYRAVCAAIQNLTAEYNRAPTRSEIAEAVDMSPDEVQRLIELATHAVSLNEPIFNDKTVSDFVADERTPSPRDAADWSIGRDVLRQAYRRLSTREQQLLYLRHNEELRVKEVALIMKISEGRISQMYKEIIVKLRAMLNTAPVS